jgi:hypothetical protein
VRFTPKTEKELAEDGLWEPGIYDFEILGAEEATSKAGNDMIKLRVKIFNQSGGSQIVFDYLMEAVAYKLRHAAEACGLLKQYEGGTLEAYDFEGKSGQAKVSIQKDKTGQYPDKNGIADYLPAPQQAAPQRGATSQRRPAPATAGRDLDDDIPF